MKNCSDKIRGYLLVAAVVMIAVGCAAQPESAAVAQVSGEPQASVSGAPRASVSGEPDAQEQSAGTAGTQTGASKEGQTEKADAAASVQEEKVTVVIPTVYESVSSQEEADAIRDKNGYESVILEEDGSLTIVMSRSQYEELLRDFRDSVDRGIAEIVGEDYGSSIEKIEYNDDYSVFTVTVEGAEIGIIERQSAEELIMYGTLYHIYTANDADHIEVNFVSRESGEVIESADSGNPDDAF